MSPINFSLLSLPSGQHSKDYTKLDQVTLLLIDIVLIGFHLYQKQELQRPLPGFVAAKFEYLSSRAYLIIVILGHHNTI